MKRSSSDRNSSSRQVHLLLHAVDGCVPYLTPSVLERHFPPSNDFWIGMAIRSTSVVPCFESKKGRQMKERDSRDPPKPQDAKKPRGYTFDAVEPDPWLLPYTRLTVASFDLLDDNETHKFKSENSNTTKQVSLWTPHGRQKISPDLYAKAADGLSSQFTLSLYDMDEEGTQKRRQKAEERNKRWFMDLAERSAESNRCRSLWYPILLPSHDEIIPSALSCDANDRVSGIALVGRWRDGLNEAIRGLGSKHVAVLCTHSLSDIMDIACGGIVDVIGTDLPTRWAKDKQALGISIEADAAAKRPRIDDKEKRSLNSDGCMDLNDEQYSRDTRALVPGCCCLACKNNEFSRAYIHHLVRAKELLAEILLFGHNLHHLLCLFRTFNNTEDKEDFRLSIVGQFDAS